MDLLNPMPTSGVFPQPATLGRAVSADGAGIQSDLVTPPPPPPPPPPGFERPFSFRGGVCRIVGNFPAFSGSAAVSQWAGLLVRSDAIPRRRLGLTRTDSD